MLINTDEPIFYFQNAHEAKEFYNRFFNNKDSQIKDYLKMFGYAERTFNDGPNSGRFSDKFERFLEELQKINSM